MRYLFIILILSFFPFSFLHGQDDEFEELDAEIEALEKEESSEDASEDVSVDSSEESSEDEFSDEDLDEAFEEDDLDQAFEEDDLDQAFEEDDLDQAFEEDDLEEDFDGSNEDISFDDFDEPGEDQLSEEEFDNADEEFELDPLQDGAEDVGQEDFPVVPEEQQAEDPIPAEEAEGFVELAPSEGSDESFHAESDDPDLDLEAQLFDIYVNFNSEKTASHEWKALAGGRESEVYGIQSGDTLWGISETFFSDGNYWPKIWSINGAIQNPHLIEPGNKIRFLLGDESDAPAFAVTEAGSGDDNLDQADEGEANQLQAKADESDEDEIEIPPPSIDSKPVLRKFPPSLPEWQNADPRGSYDETGIDYARRKILDLKDEKYLDSYVEDGAPNHIGFIAEMEQAGFVAKPGQSVYAWVVRGRAESGDRFIIIHNLGRLKAPNSSIEDSYLGYAIQIRGEIQLKETVLSRKKREGYDLFRAKVLRSTNPVNIGDEFIAGSIPKVDFTESGQRSNLVAQIIGGQFDNRKQIFGPASIVFLNRGEIDGLEVGQVLPIRANRRLGNPQSIVLENIRKIGYLKIVKTENRFSSAVILRAWEQISSGDITGKGRLLSSDSRLRGGEVQEIGEDNGDANSESFTDDFDDDFDDEIDGQEQFSEEQAEAEDDFFEDEELNEDEGLDELEEDLEQDTEFDDEFE